MDHQPERTAALKSIYTLIDKTSASSLGYP